MSTTARNKKCESPEQLRVDHEIQTNGFQQVTTTVLCPEYAQGHVLVIPSTHSEDFQRFFESNRASCSVLYHSGVGEVSAETLAWQLEDIRSHLGSHVTGLKNGEGSGGALDLTAFPWDDMVTFYIGCSFPLDEQLKTAGIPNEESGAKQNMSLYKTNIPCLSVGPFSCNVVVSMRTISRELVEKAVMVTTAYDPVCGAPIHIGDPAAIGIEDISKIEFEKPSDGGDLVPVFWASCVTTVLAARAASHPVTVCNDMDSSFACDTPVEDFSGANWTAHNDVKPCVVALRSKPTLASLLSENALKKIRCLEVCIQEDVGQRGIQNLHIRDELVKAALVLSHSKSVAIHFGFPCNAGVSSDFPDETDGPPGALAVAKGLLSLGKEVTLIARQYQLNLVRKIARTFLKPEASVLEYAPIETKGSDEANRAALEFLFPSKSPRFDALIAIEAVGRTSQGRYMTMKTRDLSDACKLAPVDELFLQAYASGKIATIAIGDGGNEIGMGKVHQRVVEHVQHGATIASIVPADHLITAGVSNWGGSALAAALFVLNQCPVHSRYVRRGVGNDCFVPVEEVLNTVKQEEEILSYIMELGVCDAISPDKNMSVDGLPFDPVHSDKLEQLLSLASSQFTPKELEQKLLFYGAPFFDN